jgi:VanZ family protein
MRLVSRFVPPLVLMGVIFFLSDTPDLKTDLGVADLILRKIVHAGVFGLLWFLWLRALGWRAPGWAAAIAVGYAIGDEFHQSFVPGRDGSPVDVAIDAAGVAATWLLRARARRARRLDPAALGGDQHGLRPVDRAQLPVDVVQVGADGAGRER